MKNIYHAITVETTIEKPVEEVWKIWATPSDIMQWNNPSEDWHSPRVENDLRTGGDFFFRMEAKNGSAGFDHNGKYDNVVPNERIEYTGADGRRSLIEFIREENNTRIVETFEPAEQPSYEIQKEFCQSILSNFKKYAESKAV